MENRIGTAIILVEKPESIQRLNHIISLHSELILGRQGVPLRDKGYNLISILFEGSTDRIGSFTGQIGKLNGIKIKSVLLK